MMRKSKFYPLQKALVAEFPQFAILSRRLILTPTDHVLRGLCFVPSAFSKVPFDLQAFVMPLCIPTTYIYFTFGKEIRCPVPKHGWEMDLPDLPRLLSHVVRNDALPFLEPLGTLLDVAAAQDGKTLMIPLEAKAFCLALAGCFEQAISTFDRLLEKDFDTDIPWQVETEQRARRLRSLLVEDPAAVQRQLTAWETASAESLKVDRFRSKTSTP